MTDCDRYKKLLHGYFVGTLSREERDEVDRHAASCADCGRLMEIANELTCRDLVEFLNDYIEDRLPAERRTVFERHLAICSDCTAYLQSYRATMEASAWAVNSRLPGPDQELPIDLVRAILDARNRG